jgi:hypothetical protein
MVRALDSRKRKNFQTQKFFIDRDALIHARRIACLGMQAPFEVRSRENETAQCVRMCCLFFGLTPIEAGAYLAHLFTHKDAATMISVTIELPDSLLMISDGSAPRLQEYSRFLLALKFYEIGQLTSGQSAVLCGMNRVDFLLDASRMGTPVAHLEEDELDREVRDAQRR